MMIITFTTGKDVDVNVNVYKDIGLLIVISSANNILIIQVLQKIF